MRERFAAGDYQGAIAIIEQPYRVTTLTEILERHDLDNSTYWALVRSVWLHSENIWQNKRRWRRLWTDKGRISTRHLAMEADELAALQAMPDVIAVWRGANPKHGKGLSWTIDPDIAQWFAERPRGPSRGRRVLLEGRVRKADVFAFLQAREESEIVASKVQLVPEPAQA